jgi:hypothetical protein
MLMDDKSAAEAALLMGGEERVVYFFRRGGWRNVFGVGEEARLLIPVLGFLFLIPEIEYFSGFRGFLQYYVFVHRNSCSFRFHFWPPIQ